VTRRVIRSCFAFAAAVSALLALALAVAVAWPVSHWGAMDLRASHTAAAAGGLGRGDPGWQVTRRFEIAAAAGRVHVTASVEPARRLAWGWRWAWDGGYPPGLEFGPWRYDGWVIGERSFSLLGIEGGGGESRFGQRTWTLAVPCSYLVLLLSVPLCRWLATRRRRRRRRCRLSLGRCPACGYDLTGNVSGTCPECGTLL
jgi:hypothetical protein